MGQFMGRELAARRGMEAELRDARETLASQQARPLALQSLRTALRSLRICGGPAFPLHTRTAAQYQSLRMQGAGSRAGTHKLCLEGDWDFPFQTMG